jgi:GH43 family beta-xylosidase
MARGSKAASYLPIMPCDYPSYRLFHPGLAWVQLKIDFYAVDAPKDENHQWMVDQRQVLIFRVIDNHPLRGLWLGSGQIIDRESRWSMCQSVGEVRERKVGEAS